MGLAILKRKHHITVFIQSKLPISMWAGPDILKHKWSYACIEGLLRP